MNFFSEGLADGVKEMLRAFASLITETLLAPFKFATPQDLTKWFAGLSTYMDTMIVIGIALVIIICGWAALMQIMSPRGTEDIFIHSSTDNYSRMAGIIQQYSNCHSPQVWRCIISADFYIGGYD